MELEIDVKKLVAHIESCNLQIPVRNPPHEHVGSIIADAVLQVGHRWKTHVGPRLERMRDTYPNANTISGVSALLETDGPQKLLDWHGEDELERFSLTVRFFENELVETFDNLRDWLKSDNRDRLITKSFLSNKAGIPKIADATADYYRVLVGLPDAVKVDSLVQKFLADAGIIVKKYAYKEKRSIVQLAAKQLGKRPIDLDGAIWNYEQQDNKEKVEMKQDEGLMILLPTDKIEQLEQVAQKEFGVKGAVLARIWIIERLLAQCITNNLPLKHSPPIQIGHNATNMQKIKSVVEENWSSGGSFSPKELIIAVQKKYPEVKKNEIMPADRAINKLSGYNNKNGAWIKKEPYLFARKDGRYEKYDPAHHGIFKCIDNGAGYKIIT